MKTRTFPADSCQAPLVVLLSRRLSTPAFPQFCSSLPSMASLAREIRPVSECVVVDEGLGVPGDRVWCGGEFSPPEWNGERAAKPLAVCLEPDASGECKLCPRADVVEEVETKMREMLAEDRPDCDLQHWEFGCMRTVELSKMIGYDTRYCCYQFAIWGAGCKDDTSIERRR